MSNIFTMVALVEGQGEVSAIPVLLRRMAVEIRPEIYVEVPTPIFVPKGTMLKEGKIDRYVELAHLQQSGSGAVLIVFDADEGCAATLGPGLQAKVEAVQQDEPVAVVVAVKEFEAWFIAAAPSLAGKRGLPDLLEAPADPEGILDAKGWLSQRRIDGLKYSPTVDQPALAGVFDMAAARAGSPSFDKLWREVDRLLNSRFATDDPDGVGELFEDGEDKLD